MDPVYPHVKQLESGRHGAAELGETFELRRRRTHGARKRLTRSLAAVRVRKGRTAPAGC